MLVTEPATEVRNFIPSSTEFGSLTVTWSGEPLVPNKLQVVALGVGLGVGCGVGIGVGVGAGVGVGVGVGVGLGVGVGVGAGVGVGLGVGVGGGGGGGEAEPAARKAAICIIQGPALVRGAEAL